jgi:ComF family protein
VNPFKQLAQIIYPPRCVICGDFQRRAPFEAVDSPNSICLNCTSAFETIEAPFCTICGLPFDGNDIENHPCHDCSNTRPHFEAARAPFAYEGPALEAILKLKYGKKTFVAEAVGPLLAEFVKTRFMPPGHVVVMPVPLHPKRLRERGFNQSLLLAREIAKAITGDLDYLSLKRVKHTISQTTLSRKERRKNVRNAFLLKNPGGVARKSILLVDDVMTTGNTLNECAGVLLQGGAKAVFCVTLARAVL